MPQSFLRRVMNGAGSILSGIRFVIKDAEVRRTYRLIIVALFLFSCVLYAAGIFGVLHFTESTESNAAWRSALMVLLRVLGVLVVFLLSPIVAITTCNLLFPVFSEIPFFAGLNARDQTRAQRLKGLPGLGTPASIASSLRRFVVFLLVSLGCLLLALVPVVGALLAPPLQFYVAARIVGWELLDPYFDRLELRYVDQKKAMSLYSPEVLGMGLVCAPLLAIPLVGPLLFGILQASVAEFVISQLPKSDTKHDLLSSGA